MQQKLSICCALLPHPAFVLFDEPLVGLDPHAIKQVKSLIAELREQGIGLLISTHMLDSVEDVWDQALIMVKGEIAAVYQRSTATQTGETLEEAFFRITEGDTGPVPIDSAGVSGNPAQKNRRPIMSAFLYFWRTSLKNRLLILRRKPAKLVAYLLMLIMIIAVILVSMIGLSESDRQNTDLVYLGLMVLGISYFLFAMGWSKGCKQGTSFFKMADVNLLFTSPLRPQNILAFGLINQMGSVLLSTIFLLYQIPNLVNQFDLSGGSVLMIFFCLDVDAVFVGSGRLGII